MLQNYEAECIDLMIGARRLSLLHVRDLERYVDREALLQDDTAEPPYWAHLWTGALTLARYIEEHVDCQDLAVLDLGCGLGLTGIVAGLKGGRMTFADKEADALAFAAANARLNGCPSFTTLNLDFTQEALNEQGVTEGTEQKFSLILGAEILYDRPTFPALVSFLHRHLAPYGQAIVADARRTNTEEFYQQLTQAGLRWTREERQEREGTLPLTVSLATIEHNADGYQ